MFFMFYMPSCCTFFKLLPQVFFILTSRFHCSLWIISFLLVLLLSPTQQRRKGIQQPPPSHPLRLLPRTLKEEDRRTQMHNCCQAKGGVMKSLYSFSTEISGVGRSVSLGSLPSRQDTKKQTCQNPKQFTVCIWGCSSAIFLLFFQQK